MFRWLAIPARGSITGPASIQSLWSLRDTVTGGDVTLNPTTVAGLPLRGVTVRAAGRMGTIATTTGANGAYELSGLDGDVTIDTLLAGFDPMTRAATAGAATLDFTLRS